MRRRERTVSISRRVQNLLFVLALLRWCHVIRRLCCVIGGGRGYPGDGVAKEGDLVARLAQPAPRVVVVNWAGGWFGIFLQSRASQPAVVRPCSSYKGSRSPCHLGLSGTREARAQAPLHVGVV